MLTLTRVKERQKNSLNTMSKLDYLAECARQEGFFLYKDILTTTDRNIDIQILISQTIVLCDPIPQGNWKHVVAKNGIRERTMLVRAEKMLLPQAIDKFTEEIKLGTFKLAETYRIIFLKEVGPTGNALVLGCFHDSDGGLRLYVHHVRPLHNWNPKHGSNIAWYKKQIV